MQNPAMSYSQPKAAPAPEPVVSSTGGGGDALDEFDDLTIEELRSLLDNFKNMSKGEQMDLIQVSHHSSCC